MKDKQVYQCPKCEGKKFKLVYRTYEEEPEEFHGKFMSVVCAKCEGNFWAFQIDDKVFKHAEKTWLEQELGIETKQKNIV